MAVKFDRVKVGDHLYTTYKYRMGNTTMTSVGVTVYTVLEKDEEKKMIKVSGGTYREAWKGEHFLKQCRRSRPELVETGMGRWVIKRKERKV